MPETPINSRGAWEFSACLTGSMRAWLLGPDKDELLREHTLWVFPRHHPHGWLSDAPCERAVFHFRTIPEELNRHVPARGFYRASLTPADLARLRELSKAGKELLRKPSELRELQETMLCGELSMIALREIEPRSLSGKRLAIQKTEQAMAWFSENMNELPRLHDLCRAMHISPAYLRRLFHEARGESPHAAFNRLRMEKAERLLHDPTLTLDSIAERIGLSSASALSRAIKSHFGFTPRQLRSREELLSLTPSQK